MKNHNQLFVFMVQDNGMIISFIVSGNTASPWNPFATSELTSFLNQYYNDPVATAETYWHLCKGKNNEISPLFKEC